MNGFSESGGVQLEGARPVQDVRLAGERREELLRDEVLGEIFAASVASRPAHPALVFAGRTLTYADVNARADAIARGLLARGIGPGGVVGLWMPRGADLLVAQIAITKTGAAWLPFDADAPVDRIAVCLDDADAKALLTSEELAPKAAEIGRPVLTGPGLATDGEPLPARAAGLAPDHPAYMIYTSGSTGTPKGIVISHRNICHFLRSANHVYGFQPDDVVFQGASVAFDLSMEEIWVPYLVGATLFVATPAMMGDAERLPDLIAEAGVTVLDTVPTLLAMITRDMPGVRLILLGGEALPQPLVERWATPGRRLFNTYGPTEATVVATVAEMRPGERVTIGRPIPNYTCYVVDEALAPVPPGRQGELLIGGPGVAQGYLKRPELTAEKFVANPFPGDGRDPILYRSGDAVSLDDEGNIVFHGRIDDQVKIRGFRVELGEIEAKLAAQAGVAQAAVVLRQDEGIDRLVAFLVGETGRPLDKMKLRGDLRDQLPPYMVPNHFEVVDVLPRLSSGKVDRKALRAVTLAVGDTGDEQEMPRNETEAALLVAAKRVFGNQGIPFEADFFMDLGGHSLLAARFVGAVREVPALASITLQDVYARRTLRAMADDLIERTGGAGTETVQRDLSFEPPPLRRRFLCGLAQAVALPFILTLNTVQWLGIFVTYILITGGELGFFAEMLSLILVYLGIVLVTGLIAVGAKWVILGRTKPGRYPLWGSYYFRWWLVKHLQPLLHIKWLQASPAMPLVMRMLGAKVGRDCIISDFDAGAIDLLVIGDRVATGGKFKLANAEVIGNELVIGTIEIGNDAYIGTSVVLSSGVVVGDHAEIADLTAIPENTRIPSATKWDGSPGREVGTVDVDALPEPAQASPARRRILNLYYAIALVCIPPVSLLPIFPAFYLFDKIDEAISAYTTVSYLWYLPLLAWPAALVMVALTVLLIAGARWVVLPRVKSGRYSIFSAFYIRKWTVALATEVTLETLTSLFATIYMRSWYRIMGAKIGHGAEISTNLAGRYDISHIGAKNFIADEVVYGEEEIRRGWMTLEPVRTGERVFVGNDAVVPPGADIPDGVLIGIKSKPPANERLSPGDTWFGSPPIKLPTRQKVDLGSSWTYEPSWRWKLGRAVFEALHTSFASMLFITLGILAVEVFFSPMIEQRNFLGLAVLFMAASVIIAVIQTLVVAAVKWIFMGAYKPLMKPMWSWWAMRTEAIAVLYWGLGGKVLLEHLTGTPFLPWFLRLFGAKFGQGVVMLTTDITEFDCVEVGDFCTINGQSALQTHLYEDRVMKVGRVRLEAGVFVGANATVLYDSNIGRYARLMPLTVVMKGESIPPHSEWEGAPAVPVVHKAPPQPGTAPEPDRQAA
ncbi:Pls/PosA family non-ribosomal peptide synthetase [Salinarimonas soli]|uniref:Amino acid adenylation domain-containing protein n=1 Tax=Salinarimonas soli TaxID=1638099 RepID=A0A5B2VTY4_9HYPH|nr:Pls/PosA family non-ribosomal peptide synthetase [Salinarimonas soli]KAA2242244.1 amino acid adenylation domain-containing protein [Salinarimonas soli]